MLQNHENRTVSHCALVFMSILECVTICTHMCHYMYAHVSLYVRRPNLVRLNTSTTQKEKNGLTNVLKERLKLIDVL